MTNRLPYRSGLYPLSLFGLRKKPAIAEKSQQLSFGNSLRRQQQAELLRYQKSTFLLAMILDYHFKFPLS